VALVVILVVMLDSGLDTLELHVIDSLPSVREKFSVIRL